MHKVIMKLENLRLNLLRALSDETRLKLLEFLRHGNEICVCDIEKVFNKTQSTLSRHLKTLTEADILESRREGNKKLFKVKDTQIFKLLAILDNLIKRNEKFEKIVELQQKI
ncbi:MAG: ArsR/SmtB family transcription factor [Candidatus Thorarchaeota archaeon]